MSMSPEATIFARMREEKAQQGLVLAGEENQEQRIESVIEATTPIEESPKPVNMDEIRRALFGKEEVENEVKKTETELVDTSELLSLPQVEKQPLTIEGTKNIVENASEEPDFVSPVVPVMENETSIIPEEGIMDLPAEEIASEEMAQETAEEDLLPPPTEFKPKIFDLSLEKGDVNTTEVTASENLIDEPRIELVENEIVAEVKEEFDAKEVAEKNRAILTNLKKLIQIDESIKKTNQRLEMLNLKVA